MSIQVLHGDCRVLLKNLRDSSVHAVVTDPPYHTGLMNKDWDKGQVAFDPDTWAQCLRVLKPGGHLLAFGGSRTYHRLACAIEDAGFEIRDQIMWLYAGGFPKSMNISKMIGKAADVAAQWDGWGTALRPSHEPIVVARRPFRGTVIANVREHGTAAFNIDACRTPTSDRITGGVRCGAAMEGWKRPFMDDPEAMSRLAETKRLNQEKSTLMGRWPANVVHDGSDEVLAGFPDAPGAQGNVKGTEPSATGTGDAVMYGGPSRVPQSVPRRADAGSAARFFYCAKASRADREAGLESLPSKQVGVTNFRNDADAERNGRLPQPRKNTHITVKPTELMRWLVRLVTPPGGVILDPFAGSGSTGRAAALEGFHAILMELEAEHVEIARLRVAEAQQQVSPKESLSEQPVPSPA